MTTTQALDIVRRICTEHDDITLSGTVEEFWTRHNALTDLIRRLEARPGPIGRSVNIAVADGYATYMVVDIQYDSLRKEKAARLVHLPGPDGYYLPSVGADGWYPLVLIQATWDFEDRFNVKNG